MSNDRFLDQVNRELRAMVREEERLAQQHDVEVKRRAVIRSRTAELMKVRTVYQEMMGMTPSQDSDDQPAEVVSEPTIQAPEPTNAAVAPASAVTEQSNGSILPTTADLAEALMKANGGKIKIRDILDEAIRIGKLQGKASDYGSVFGALKGNPKRFVKIGPGEFALVGSEAINGTADGGAR